jgi:hypothetical protein
MEEMKVRTVHQREELKTGRDDQTEERNTGRVFYQIEKLKKGRVQIKEMSEHNVLHLY